MATDERPFLSLLSPEDVAALRASGRTRTFPQGASIFIEGETSDRVAIVETGTVKISFFTEDGREILLGVRGPGDLLGELSALDGLPRSATATALDPVTALVLPSAAFKSFVLDRPEVAWTLLATLGARLREADVKRIDFGALDTAGRVAKILLDLAERYGETEERGTRIALRLSQQDLAGWTGSSREAVSKALQSLRSRRIVETHRRGITILDMDGLRKRVPSL